MNTFFYMSLDCKEGTYQLGCLLPSPYNPRPLSPAAEAMQHPNARSIPNGTRPMVVRAIQPIMDPTSMVFEPDEDEDEEQTQEPSPPEATAEPAALGEAAPGAPAAAEKQDEDEDEDDEEGMFDPSSPFPIGFRIIATPLPGSVFERKGIATIIEIPASEVLRSYMGCATEVAEAMSDGILGEGDETNGDQHGEDNQAQQ